MKNHIQKESLKKYFSASKTNKLNMPTRAILFLTLLGLFFNFTNKAFVQTKRQNLILHEILFKICKNHFPALSFIECTLKYVKIICLHFFPIWSRMESNSIFYIKNGFTALKKKNCSK